MNADRIASPMALIVSASTKCSLAGPSLISASNASATSRSVFAMDSNLGSFSDGSRRTSSGS